MNWLRKLLGVDKAIQEAKDELLLEIEATRKYADVRIRELVIKLQGSEDALEDPDNVDPSKTDSQSKS